MKRFRDTSHRKKRRVICLDKKAITDLCPSDGGVHVLGGRSLELGRVFLEDDAVAGIPVSVVGSPWRETRG